MSPTYAEVRAHSARQLCDELGLDPTRAGREVDHLARAVTTAADCLITAPDHALEPACREQLAELVAARARGTPLALVLGNQDFHGINLLCTPATLVPRAETETLVETAVELLPTDSPAAIADLGTGSGAIACAIACARPAVQAFAYEAEAAAAKVATSNVERLGLGSRVAVVHGDWSLAPTQSFDLVVSNPPYVPSGYCRQQLDAGVRLGPRLALDGGPDGLAVPGAALAVAARAVRPGGHVLIEHGIGQHHALARAARAQGLEVTGACRDLANIKRVLHARAREASDA